MTCQLFDGNFLGIILPRCMGIITSQYKDPYKPSSITECHKGFDHCSCGVFLVRETDSTRPENFGVAELVVGGFKLFLFSPDPWGDDPI